MQSREKLFLPFIFFFVLSLITLLLFYLPFMQGVRGGLENGMHPLRAGVINLFVGKKERNDEINMLRGENAALTVKLSQMDEVMKENAALHDQFQTTDIAPSKLVPAKIVGMQPFLPGSLTPDFLTIDKGMQEGIKKGQTVIEKNIFIGTVVQVTSHLASVQLSSAKDISLTGKDAKTGAQGVVNGQGEGAIIMGNVVLSDKLGKNDPVITFGSKASDGSGIPEGLIIGSIMGVDRKPSSLFQTAAIAVPFDPTRLTEVFIITN